MNWLDKVLGRVDATAVEKISQQRVAIFESMFENSKDICSENKSELKVYDYVFHIGDKEKYQILDFSSTIDGVCYIKNMESGAVGTCLIGSLKRIAR